MRICRNGVCFNFVIATTKMNNTIKGELHNIFKKMASELNHELVCFQSYKNQCVKWSIFSLDDWIAMYFCLLLWELKS